MPIHEMSFIYWCVLCCCCGLARAGPYKRGLHSDVYVGVFVVKERGEINELEKTESVFGSCCSVEPENPTVKSRLSVYKKRHKRTTEQKQ